MIRRTIAISLVAVLALFAPAGAQEPVVGVGTAQTTLDLADLNLSGLPAGLPVSALQLGGLTSYASTVPDAALNALGGGQPFALSSVRLPVGEDLIVRSDGNTGRPGQELDLGVGSLTIGDLLATVDEVEARSIVNALSGQIDVGLAGLGVSATGVTSVVSATNAAAANGAMLHDLSLDLTDILPVELLQQLPLDVLLKLTDEIGVPGLSQTLTRTLRDARALLNELEAIETVHGTIDQAQAQLAAATAGLAAQSAQLGELSQSVTSQVGLLDAACQISLPGGLDLGDTSVDSLLGGLAGFVSDPAKDLPLPPAPDLGLPDLGLGGGGGLLGGGGILGFSSTSSADHNPCHTLQATVDDLLDVEATIATLNRVVDQVQTRLETAVRRVNRLLDGFIRLIESFDLANLPALLQALVDGLAGAELLGIEQLSVGVTSFADAHGSNASALCELRGLQVLGQALPDTCAELEGALGEVTSLIEGLLAELPIVATVAGAAVNLPVDVIWASAPKLSSSEDGRQEGDFFVATSGVEGLRLNVASLQLTQITDGLLGDLLGEVGDLVGQLEGLTGVTVDLSAVQAAVDQALAVVGGLPAGDLLAGVTTPGIALAALDLGSESRFSTAASGLTPIGTPGTPGYVPPAPGTGQTPTPAGDLPTTGGGVAAALLLLVAGGGLTWWLRRRPAL